MRDIAKLKAAYEANPANVINGSAYRNEILRQNLPCYYFNYNQKDFVVSKILHFFDYNNCKGAIFETFEGKYFFFIDDIKKSSKIANSIVWQTGDRKVRTRHKLRPNIELKDWYIIPRRIPQRVEIPSFADMTIQEILDFTDDDFARRLRNITNPPETLENAVVPADWLIKVLEQRNYQMPGGLQIVVIKINGEVRKLYERTANEDDEIEIERIYGYSTDYNNPVQRFYSYDSSDVSFGKEIYSCWVDAFQELWNIFGEEKTWQEMLFYYLCSTGKFSEVSIKNKADDDFSCCLSTDSRAKELPYEVIIGMKMLREYNPE